jgi:hypothetical protein
MALAAAAVVGCGVVLHVLILTEARVLVKVLVVGKILNVLLQLRDSLVLPGDDGEGLPQAIIYGCDFLD